MGMAADRYWSEVSQHGASPDGDMALLNKLATLIGHQTPLPAITDELVSRAVARRSQQFRMDKPHLGVVSAGTVTRTVTELLRRVVTRARRAWRVTLP